MDGETGYTLTISQSAARYAAQSGDSYILAIFTASETKYSTGTVTVSGSDFSLSKGTGLKVTVEGSAIKKMEGSITLDSGGAQAAPTADLTPPPAINSAFAGTWTAGTPPSGGVILKINSDGTFEETFPYTENGKNVEWKGKGNYFTKDTMLAGAPTHVFGGPASAYPSILKEARWYSFPEFVSISGKDAVAVMKSDFTPFYATLSGGSLSLSSYQKGGAPLTKK
jgi:hypothetical protein